jgi:hypothetical protein
MIWLRIYAAVNHACFSSFQFRPLPWVLKFLYRLKFDTRAELRAHRIKVLYTLSVCFCTTRDGETKNFELN